MPMAARTMVRRGVKALIVLSVVLSGCAGLTAVSREDEAPAPPVAATQPSDRLVSQGDVRPIVILVVDDAGKPIRGAKVGAGMSYWEFAAGPAPNGSSIRDSGVKVRWDLPGSVPAVTDANGITQIPAGAAGRDISVLYALDEHGGRAALARLETGKAAQTVVMTAVPACRISARFASQWLRDRHTALNDAYVYIGWAGNQMVLSGTSSQQRIELFVPPGKYALRLGGWGAGVGAPGTGGIPLAERNTQVEVQTGQHELDLGEVALEPTDVGRLVGQPAPDLNGIRFWKNGAVRSLADLKGQYVLLDFWSLHCGSCPTSLRQSMRCHDRWRDRGLKVIAIHDYDSQLASAANLDVALTGWRQKFWDGRDLPFTVAIDGPSDPHDGPNLGATHDAYHIVQWPTSVLIDPEGRVAHVFEGGAHVSALEPLFDQMARN
jgi:uncharacterized protein YceK